MTTSPARDLHRLRWFLSLLLLLVATILSTPFLFTTRFVDLALNRLLPANHITVRRATLSLSGNLVLRDLVLRDTGAMARRSLVTIHEIDANFNWSELLARRFRDIHVSGAVVFARTSGQSQLTMLALLTTISSAKSSPGSSPLWIDQVDVHGIVHCEALNGVPAADFPLSIHLGMSGDRMMPSRLIRLTLGDMRQLSEHPLKEPGAVTSLASNTHQDFGLLAEIEIRPEKGITRLTIDRLAAWRLALMIDPGVLRQLMPVLPEELQEPIEANLSELSGSGVLDFPPQSASRRLSGSITFAGLRIHAPGDSNGILAGFEDLSGAMDIDTPLPPGPGALITVGRIHVRDAKASLDARILRRYVSKLPPEIQGYVRAGIGDLTVSAKLERGPNGDHIAGKLAFARSHFDLPAGSQSLLSAGELTGATSFDTLMPPGLASFFSIEKMHAMNIAGTIDAGNLRKYVAGLPGSIRGPVTANLQALDLSGMIGSAVNHAIRFIGLIRLQDFNVIGANGDLELDRMTTGVRIDSPLRWDPAALTAHEGELHWSAFKYKTNSVGDLEARWRIDGPMLFIDHISARMLAGQMAGTTGWDLVTHAMPHCDFQISHVDMHTALTNIAPERLDAQGTVSGSIHLARSKEGELSGKVDLAFDGPGILQIKQVQELKQRLVGSFGADMANLAMHDLEHYPFKEGRVQLQSAGENSELRIKFIRQPRSAADKVPPRKEIINGHEVWVGSLVVPTIDMTLPIRGKSLAEILSMAGGFHSLVQATEP